jgi:hypothetical protein
MDCNCPQPEEKSGIKKKGPPKKAVKKESLHRIL